MPKQIINPTLLANMNVVERNVDTPMPPEAASRALVLLARWARRRAQKWAKEGGDGSTGLVTVDVSKRYRMATEQN